MRRIGHVGTLDPLATGVLPLVVGRATRLASLLSEGDKVYRSVFRLGIATDTYDVTGEVVTSSLRRGGWTQVTLDTVEAIRSDFVGTFSQVPPPYSAKKIGGVRAYRLARRREPVAPKPVEVTVRQFEIEELTDDRLLCRITCTPGFYVRSLAHDFGRALGCGGCLEQLRREQSGAFSLEQALTMDQLERDHATAVQHLIPIADLLPDLPRVVVTDRGAGRAAHGNSLTPTEVEPASGALAGSADTPRPAGAFSSAIKVYDRNGALLAIAEGSTAGVLHPRIVLV